MHIDHVGFFWFLSVIRHSVVWSSNTLLSFQVMGQNIHMSHYHFPKFLEQLSLEQLTHKASNNFCSGAILHGQVPFLNLVYKKETKNVDCLDYFNQTALTISFKYNCWLVLLVKIFFLMSYLCAYTNSLVHKIIVDISSALTSLDSVLLQVFNFCFLEKVTGIPVP